MAMVFLAFGSNLGDRLANIVEARKELAILPETILMENAPIYETKPMGGPADQEDYLNSVSLIDTKLEPHDLLKHLQTIERRLGRRREGETGRWGPRLIDIDILFWDDSVVEEADLVIPHPRLAERAFVLVPLADIYPDMLHPVMDLTIRELLERIGPEHEGVRRLPL